MVPASCRNLKLLDKRRRLRNGLAMQLHAFNVEFNRFADQLPGFFKRRAGSNAPGEVWDVGAVASGRLFKKNRVLVHFSPACFSIDAGVFSLMFDGGLGIRENG